ncbi:MAG: T9SS type A sorting domain-containing protein [Cryomorphaceae bacterium]|nr:T9SS type A sorting domain-containing protein [Cryomorphaceae bacterium]
MKKIFLAVMASTFTLLTSPSIIAQHNHSHGPNEVCGTDEIHEELFGNDREYQQSQEEVEAWIQQYISENSPSEIRKNADGTETDIHRIPVVFHVMYADERDNISRYQIMDAIRVLNEDFRRKNADTNNTRPQFLGVAADLEVEFHLARVDPNGQCSDGINRVKTPAAASSTNNIKGLSMWNNKKYLNIWTVRTINSNNPTGTVLGYAFFPNPNQSGLQDGILLRHDRVGTIGTSGSVGRTLTHEAGHYFSLHHPFRDGCFGGDFVSDTPPADAPNFGCNLNSNSCSHDPRPDMIENYMDYANDVCTNIFTQGQKVRAKAVLNNASLRGDVSDPDNLKETGVVGGDICKPLADFFPLNNVICAGEKVKFVDASNGADPGSYQWQFPGGTPSTSTERYPEITYNQEGVYPVYLTVSNPAGSETKMLWRAVWVKYEAPSPFQNWLIEDFENIDVPNGNWSLTQHASSEVEVSVTSNAAYSGNKSVRIPINTVDEHGFYRIISPNISLARSQSAVLNFAYAFAPNYPNFHDRMIFKVSTDCGETWVNRKTYSGNLLQTAPVQSSGDFIPQNQAEWRTDQLNMSIYASPDEEVLFMWEIEARGGNNFYLDNVYLDVVLSEDKYDLNKQTFAAFPNPTAGDLNIIYRALQDGSTTFSLHNATGQVVWHHKINATTGVKNEINVESFKRMASGIYFLHMENNGAKEVIKVVKTN